MSAGSWSILLAKEMAWSPIDRAVFGVSPVGCRRASHRIRPVVVGCSSRYADYFPNSRQRTLEPLAGVVFFRVQCRKKRVAIIFGGIARCWSVVVAGQGSRVMMVVPDGRRVVRLLLIAMVRHLGDEAAHLIFSVAALVQNVAGRRMSTPLGERLYLFRLHGHWLFFRLIIVVDTAIPVPKFSS